MTLPPPPGLGPRHALFLDFDGTLAGFRDDPDKVAMPETALRAILQLSDCLGGALAIVSGRDIRDLSRRVPQTLWRAGGHGVSICAPGEEPPRALEPPPKMLCDAVEAAAAQFAGVWCEFKGPVIAVHYRQAPHAMQALGALLQQAVAKAEGYRLQSGKLVFEAKPARANKGRAVDWLMEQPLFSGRTPVMVGDDATDEDAFAVVIARGGFAVKVGEGETLASYRLPSPGSVTDWLGDMTTT